jgi:hypothetical protein
MDPDIYPEAAINKFLDENLLFKDAKLKKYYDRNEQRDLGKFRSRVHNVYSKKDFDNIVYLLVTNSLRDIILQTVGEISEYMKNMGDLIVSGGEAFNLYVEYKNRIITTDIDAKFVPRLPVNPKFFGKLQATKLILWDKLGEIAKKLNTRVRKRLMSMKKKHPKLFKFLGINLPPTGPAVTRRYTLIKKKKSGSGNVPKKGDVFIDVELFALDLNIRFYTPKNGKIENITLGGILDIPFMRPKEFGYEVVLTRRKGVTYKDQNTGKLVRNNTIYVASKEFLIEDIYLMSKLKLRPEKKEKDRQRLIRLAQLIDNKVNTGNNIDEIFKRIKPRIIKRGVPVSKKNARVPVSQAARVDPFKYKNFTTKPSEDKLSKQIVHGLKPVTKTTNVNGYKNSSGNKRLNLKNLKWKNVNNNSYVKNEFNLRPENPKKLPNNINFANTLYGYNPRRNSWVPKNIINKSGAIPFVGLKK